MGFRFAVHGHDDIALPELRYGDFHWLRDAFAAEAGLGGLQFLGDGWAGITLPPIKRKPWSEVTDPLRPFLQPKDTDGRMSPDECGRCATRIEELAAQISSGKNFFERRASRLGFDDVEKKVVMLVTAMRECAKRKVDLTWM